MLGAAMSDTILESPITQEYASVSEMPKLLSKEEIKYFSQVNGWKFASAIATDVLIIVLTVWLSERYWNPLLYFCAVVIMGSRLHALAVLMHDAAHYRAFSNRRVNDTVGELLAWPVTLTLQGYRNSHISHHRDLNTEKDLEWVRKLGKKEFIFPMSGRDMLLILFQFASGIKAYGELMDAQKTESSVYVSPQLRMVRRICFLTLLGAAFYFGFWKQLVLYWVIPLFTSLLLFAYVRSVADHFCVEYTHALNQTRTVLCSFWERFIFAPHGINYHIEHHIYPSVPFYRLAELHKHLMTKEAYIRHAHVTKGYGELLKECLPHTPVIL